MTIFRELFLISCNFFIFHRNRFYANEITMRFLLGRFKEKAKICFSTLKTIMENVANNGSPGEIWFFALHVPLPFIYDKVAVVGS